MTDENTNGVRPDDRGARAEAIRQALSDRAEDLFRLAWGEPTKANGRHWRARETSARSMVVQGPKRGQWFDHTAGTGGDLLDLVAIELCGLNSARDDFPRVLQEAAKFCGITDNENIDLSALMVRKAEREAKSALEAASKAQSDAQLIKALQARALPLSGSPAASYLASRGIDVMPEGWSYLPPIHGLGVLSPHRPALVAWAVDAAGQVTGGQRVLILNDGSKAPEAPRKPAFGTIGGSPARIPARVESGPLCIAEGPETAAAIAQATGFEVWAVFGASGFATAPPPLDRQVIFCPDQDATDSPAAKAFDAARDAHAQRGVDVWVARAPEPEGSKRDLADTLRDSGPEVVERALAQAVKFRHREEVEAPAGNPQRQITALPPVMDADRARARLQVEVTEGLRRDGVTLIEATLGLGKTTAAIEGLKTLFDDAKSKGVMKGAVVMAFPMHRLGRQVVKDIEAALPGRSVVQLYGVEAKDPNNPSETVCKQLDAYRERKNLLLDNAELCGACPFAGDCLYQASLGAVADIYVTSHERLKAAQTPLQSDQTLLATVIDENPLNALISANRRPVPLAALMAAPTRMTRKGKQAQKIEQEADLLAFRQRLQKTIEAHGPGYLRLPDLSGWTSGDAKAAHKLEWGRKIEDEEHPDIGHNRTVTAAAAIFAEIQRSLDDAVPENARLQIKHGENGLECVLSGLRPISEPYRTAPVLMLDATANADIAALLAGEALAHHAEIRARENITIEQDPNLSGAKSFFFEKGKPTGNVANAAYFAKAQAMNGRTAVISNKDTIAAMGLPAEIKTGHFNALRGLNEMQDADHSIIIGRTLPPPEAIARMVGAIWGTPCTGDLDHKGAAWRTVESEQVLRLEQTKAATHSDERGEMILRLIRDAEVTQAIGRLRAVNRTDPVRCTVISDAVLDYPVRLVDLRRTLQAHGTLGPMLDRGAVFLSPSQASKAYPDLYASKQAAAKVLDRISDWATFSIRGLYGKGCPVVELHTPRARNTTLAIIAPWVEDAAAEVKRHLPNTEVMKPTAEIVSLPAAPVSTPAPDTAPADVVNMQDSPAWKRHRAKLDSMGRVALALHKRVQAAGLPIGSRLSQVALVLHETQDKAQVARALRLTAQQVDDAMNGLYVMGLIDADGALDGPLKRRKLVWAVGGHNPMTAAYAAQRRAPVRLMG